MQLGRGAAEGRLPRLLLASPLLPLLLRGSGRGGNLWPQGVPPPQRGMASCES